MRFDSDEELSQWFKENAYRCLPLVTVAGAVPASVGITVEIFCSCNSRMTCWVVAKCFSVVGHLFTSLFMHLVILARSWFCIHKI